MAEQTGLHGSPQRRQRVSAGEVAVGIVAVAAPLVLAPSIAFAKMDRQMLAAFAGAPVVSAAELDKQRGGFMLPNGALVNFGMEIQEFVNNTLKNDVKVDFSVQNHFTVTQTQGTTTTTTTYSQLPNGGLSFQTPSNGGLTQQTVNIANNTIQTLVQNSANNQALKTVTTVNVSTQGLAQTLQQLSTNAQIMNTIHMNSWMHH